MSVSIAWRAACRSSSVRGSRSGASAIAVLLLPSSSCIQHRPGRDKQPIGHTPGRERAGARLCVALAALRPMLAASQAEGRLYARWHANLLVRQAVRAAVAAMLCLVDGNDPTGATAWLSELVRLMPRRRELPPPLLQWRRSAAPALPAAAS